MIRPDIGPSGIRIAVDLPTARADKRPSIQFVPCGGRKDCHIDGIAGDDIFHHRTGCDVFHRKILGSRFARLQYPGNLVDDFEVVQILLVSVRKELESYESVVILWVASDWEVPHVDFGEPFSLRAQGPSLSD